jgi:ABC-type uncharacterized transport system ATPase subunit
MSHTTHVEPTAATAAQTAQPLRPANPGQPVVEVADLRLTYRGSTTPAVDGVSFGVAAGEVFGFLGPNAAGRSTS